MPIRMRAVYAVAAAAAVLCSAAPCHRNEKQSTGVQQRCALWGPVARLRCLSSEFAQVPAGRAPAKRVLQLRGGLGGGGLGGGGLGRGPGAFYEDSRGVANEDEFFRKFGSGPGNMDLSSSKFEIRPDSFNDTDSLMDGMGLWDYPEEYRLLGEHIPPRVGHRVRTSPFLRVRELLLYGAAPAPSRRRLPWS